jgi:hypothetical protein
MKPPSAYLVLSPYIFCKSNGHVYYIWPLKGIRWLAMNGGIRWVSLNEREKAVNEGGGKEDKRRKKHSKGALLDFGGERALFFILETVLGIFIFGKIGRLYYWFLVGEACCRTEIGGTRLLGVLGSGARNSHGILELGSRIGCS